MRHCPLQFSDMNEEFLVSASHQLALISSLPFVTHRPSLLPIECLDEDLRSLKALRKYPLMKNFFDSSTSRGRRSRNKVIEGEPAVGIQFEKLNGCMYLSIIFNPKNVKTMLIVIYH